MIIKTKSCLHHPLALLSSRLASFPSIFYHCKDNTAPSRFIEKEIFPIPHSSLKSPGTESHWLYLNHVSIQTKHCAPRLSHALWFASFRPWAYSCNWGYGQLNPVTCTGSGGGMISHKSSWGCAVFKRSRGCILGRLDYWSHLGILKCTDFLGPAAWLHTLSVSPLLSRCTSDSLPRPSSFHQPPWPHLSLALPSLRWSSHTGFSLYLI